MVWTRQCFLRYATKAHVINEKTDKLDFIKIWKEKKKCFKVCHQESESPQVERNYFQIMCMIGTYIKNILKIIKT